VTCPTVFVMGVHPLLSSITGLAVALCYGQAVDLANCLRRCIGSDGMAAARESMGGLLRILERHPSLFVVRRVPTRDAVVLVADNDALAVSEAIACTLPPNLSLVLFTWGRPSRQAPSFEATKSLTP
jgi:hypothetical protein